MEDPEASGVGQIYGSNDGETWEFIASDVELTYSNGQYSNLLTGTFEYNDATVNVEIETMTGNGFATFFVGGSETQIGSYPYLAVMLETESSEPVTVTTYHPIDYHFIPVDNSTITFNSNHELKGFSGNYNDLTNKPTIPAAVSGVNDGTNWTSLTIGSDTYGIGGGSTPSNMVTTDTSQEISGSKTFTSYVTTMGNNFRIRQPSTGTGASTRPTVSFRRPNDDEVGFLQFHPTNNQMVFGCDERYAPGIRIGLRQYNSSGAYSVLLPVCGNKSSVVGTGDLNFPLGVIITKDRYGNVLSPTPYAVADANGMIDITNLLDTYFGAI